MERTDAWSLGFTLVVPRSWRLFFVVFLVRMWRLNAWVRLILPLPRTLKRFFALRLVFILGMAIPYFRLALGDSRGECLQDQDATCFGYNDSLIRSLTSFWRQHHHHLPAFHLGKLLDHPVAVEIRLHAPQQPRPEFLVCHLPTAETQGHLGFIPIFEETNEISQLDLVVAFIGAGPKLDFLDLDLLLFEFGFVPLLGFAILVLAVIHQPAYRWLSQWCNFHQIRLSLFRHGIGGGYAHDANLFAFGAYQANLGRGNLPIDPQLFFLSDKSSKLINNYAAQPIGSSRIEGAR